MYSLNCRWGFKAADRHAIRLLRILGPKSFKILQEEFGGKRIWVPKRGARYPCAACKTRLECAKRWRAEGDSPTKIAEHLGVSIKTVYRLLDGFGRTRSRRETRGRSGRAIIEPA